MLTESWVALYTGRAPKSCVAFVSCLCIDDAFNGVVSISDDIASNDRIFSK
jgi:hypothetical protein